MQTMKIKYLLEKSELKEKKILKKLGYVRLSLEF